MSSRAKHGVALLVLPHHTSQKKFCLCSATPATPLRSLHRPHWARSRTSLSRGSPGTLKSLPANEKRTPCGVLLVGGEGEIMSSRAKHGVALLVLPHHTSQKKFCLCSATPATPLRSLHRPHWARSRTSLSRGSPGALKSLPANEKRTPCGVLLVGGEGEI